MLSKMLMESITREEIYKFIERPTFKNFLSKNCAEDFFRNYDGMGAVKKITVSTKVYNLIYRAKFSNFRQLNNRAEIKKKEALAVWFEKLIDVSLDLESNQVLLDGKPITAPKFPFFLEELSNEEIADEILNRSNLKTYNLQYYRVYDYIHQSLVDFEQNQEICSEIIIPTAEYSFFYDVMYHFDQHTDLEPTMDFEGYAGTLWAANVFTSNENDDIGFIRSRYSPSVDQCEEQQESPFEELLISKIENINYQDAVSKLEKTKNELEERNRRIDERNKKIDELQLQISQLKSKTLTERFKKLYQWITKGFFS